MCPIEKSERETARECIREKRSMSVRSGEKRRPRPMLLRRHRVSLCSSLATSLYRYSGVGQLVVAIEPAVHHDTAERRDERGAVLTGELEDDPIADRAIAHGGVVNLRPTVRPQQGQGMTGSRHERNRGRRRWRLSRIAARPFPSRDSTRGGGGRNETRKTTFLRGRLGGSWVSGLASRYLHRVRITRRDGQIGERLRPRRAREWDSSLPLLRSRSSANASPYFRAEDYAERRKLR